MVFPTHEYHDRCGLAPKKHIFTIVYGENYCEARGKRTNNEGIPEQEVSAKIVPMN
jgi:hypothetical protein